MGLDSLLTDGRLYAGYIRKNMDDGTMQRFFNAGGIWNQSEFSFEFLAKGGGWGAKVLSSKPLGVPIGPFMNRFGGAYTNALNVATLETFKGMVGVNDVLFRALGNRRATALITEAFGGFKISGKSSEQMAASAKNWFEGAPHTNPLVTWKSFTWRLKALGRLIVHVGADVCFTGQNS